jgi:hypothetical protein
MLGLSVTPFYFPFWSLPFLCFLTTKGQKKNPHGTSAVLAPEKHEPSATERLFIKACHTRVSYFHWQNSVVTAQPQSSFFPARISEAISHFSRVLVA